MTRKRKKVLGKLPSLLERLDLAEKMQRWAPVLRKPRRRMPTGWPLLDKFLRGGYVISSCNILGAPPGSGKSVFGQISAERHVLNGGTAIHFDFENGEERCLRRLVYRRAQIDPDKHRISRTERQRLDKEIALWSRPQKNGGLYLLSDDRKLTQARFHEQVTAVRRKIGDAGSLFVVVDSLQKLYVNLEQRRAGLDHWLRQFEETRAAADCVILIVSELARPPREKKAYLYTGMNFKETGDAEYTVDLAMGFTTLSNHLQRAEISKSRDGRLIGSVAKYRLIEPYQGMEEEEIKK